MIRTAKVIESKTKIRSIPVEHLRFMGIHDAAHVNLHAKAFTMQYTKKEQLQRQQTRDWQLSWP